MLTEKNIFSFNSWQLCYDILSLKTGGLRFNDLSLNTGIVHTLTGFTSILFGSCDYVM